MLQFFPYSNVHELNLDWILEFLKTVPLTVNNTHPDAEGNINLPTVSGVTSVNGIGADGYGNVKLIEYISDLDNAADEFHIYRWMASDDHTPYDAAYFPAGEGFCFSSSNSTGYLIQISNGLGINTIATRTKSPGDPWTAWRYFNTTYNVASGISFNGLVIDTGEPYVIKAEIINGIALVYIECKTAAAAGNGDTIATGLPVPNTGNKYSIGMIQDSLTGDLKPCRYNVSAAGDCNFSYLGAADQAGDRLIISAVYAVD